MLYYALGCVIQVDSGSFLSRVKEADYMARTNGLFVLLCWISVTKLLRLVFLFNDRIDTVV